MPFVKDIGGTFCKYLAYRYQIPKRFFNDCPDTSCRWDDWNQVESIPEATINNTSSIKNINNLNITVDLNTTSKEESKKTKRNKSSNKYVVSYAHNGFGNQLWEHSIAFMIAESIQAKFFIAIIPDNLSPGGFLPPNTWAGISVMEKLLPKHLMYENLPIDSSVRKVCDSEDFYLSDRPIDWRNKNYTNNFRPNLYNILKDNNPRCLKFLGYFQNLPLCADDARKLWTPNLFVNFTMKPAKNDISIYLRCLPRHYHFNDKHWYDIILSNIEFDRVWLFQAPECPTKIDSNPSKDGLVASVLRLLYEKYNATRWPKYKGNDEVGPLLHDLAGLALSNKMILPLSSWAYWAGLLSNASEIHVNGITNYHI